MKVFHIISILTLAIFLLGVTAGDISFWAFLGLIVLYFIISVILSANNQQKEQEKRETQQRESLKSLEGFKPTKKAYKNDGLIALDGQSKEIVVQKNNGQIKRFNFSDIISCEVVEDGETVTRKSNKIGRAVIGGVLAGGAGAIIGGLSGKEKQNKEIESIALKIIFKTSEIPYTFKLTFFDAKQATSHTKRKVKLSESVYGKMAKDAINEVSNWKEKIESIINQYDKEENETQAQTSVSDEIEKLNSLKEKGAITQEEFDKQKQKLLNKQV